MYNPISKKILLFSIVLLLDTVTIANAQNVYIPDYNFKAILLANTAINTNRDNEIQLSEAEVYTGKISVPNKNILSLVGIEEFTALTSLDCSYNQLNSLDVSKNTALTWLDCSYNNLASLDVGKNTALTWLSFYSNRLTIIDLKNNTILDTLYCFSNQLNSLDISENITLSFLACSSNQLSSLDVSKNTNLTSLECFSNKLSSLDVSKNTNLTILDCSSNQLNSLDVSKNTALTYLRCSSNQLNSLDLNTNTALIYLYCSSNQLIKLDLNKNTTLTYFDCSSNQLINLDLSNNLVLATLKCSNNQLTSLNIQNGNNVKINSPMFSSNPDLSCIQVDDVAYADENFTNKDSWAHYSIDCSGTITGINSRISIAPKVYPNPATSLLTIDIDETIVSKEIVGLDGLVVQQENNSKNTLNISNIPSGLYFIKLRTTQGVYEHKFVKE